MARWSLTVNGKQQQVEAESDMPLLWVLRDLLGLMGTKFGCGVGACGACNVHLDDELVPSCTVPVSAVGGRKIVTIEGLSGDTTHPVQQAWLEEKVSQCGYCQPGQIMAAATLLKNSPDPSDAEIDKAMARTLCRCGAYPRIRKAIHRAAKGESS
ncbi:MAG TPA: (2Fe-2S)-binding protein [Gammaproteobacteria bacterium]|nr:(2Fe-2S)-binding protein [Gammaproteobacteria bacterium]